MRVLVLNSGSSSIKYRVLDITAGRGSSAIKPERILLTGAIKGIGGSATVEITREGGARSKTTQPLGDHAHALRVLFDQLGEGQGVTGGGDTLSKVDAVGHRVVHGGDQFTQPTVITEQIETEIDALSELAPLHNPACLEGIRGAKEVLGSDVPMVAVFDTAFHRTMPATARTYALPFDLATRHRIRRYGFHGIAHHSLAAGYSTFTGRPLDTCRLITLQLGNGCSATAISGGKSVETSMGFTPLEGLVMGTRSGDVDPSVVSYVAQREKVEVAEVERWLNERSGLLGVSGRTNDMRELLQAVTEEKEERAQLAIDLFCYRARKYIGAYLAVLGGADAVVFGGGIGEASSDIRARICDGMEWCGLRLDQERNKAAAGLQPGQAAQISANGANLAAYVVAADEETWIALETVRCLQESSASPL